MKITTAIIAASALLSAAGAWAGPGSFGSGGTNLWSTNLCVTNIWRTNYVGTNFCSTNIVRTNLWSTNHFSTNMVRTNFFNPLSRYDLNGDGTITSNELATVAASEVQHLQDRLFGEYDTNGDGTITSDEILAVTEAAAEDWLTRVLA